jgi:hypothetical protein
MKHALLLASLIALTVLTDAFGQSTAFSIQTVVAASALWAAVVAP